MVRLLRSLRLPMSSPSLFVTRQSWQYYDARKISHMGWMSIKQMGISWFLCYSIHVHYVLRFQTPSLGREPGLNHVPCMLHVTLRNQFFRTQDSASPQSLLNPVNQLQHPGKAVFTRVLSDKSALSNLLTLKESPLKSS